MTNKHGEFIWYELMTSKPQQAQAFYETVLDWKVTSHDPGYSIIEAGGMGVGGVLTLSDEMCAEGARPVWIGYVAVDDVDEAASKVAELGGSLLMPPKDIPDIGRLAMVADPQGIPFYLMRGTMEERSTAFSAEAPGHCCWNELVSPDQDGAIAFYGALLGWENTESIPISDGVEYKFLHHHGAMIGAVSPCTDPQQPAGWTFYFRVADIGVAKETIVADGGDILFGPEEVPGSDYILIGKDTEGVILGLAGKR